MSFPLAVRLAFSLSLPALLAAQDTTGVGSLSGVVLSAANQPLANARVCLNSTFRCATSDPQGAFRLIDIRAGLYRLTVTPPDQPALQGADVDIRAGGDVRIDVSVAALDAVAQSVTVTEGAFVAPEEVKNSGFLVRGREIYKAAGALQDVTRYVQTLPGVVIGSDDIRNDIIVRGGSPLENLFVVDNIEIPNINAFANFASAGGTVSLLDAQLISDVTFLTGGYPAPFINRTSSVLQITQREGDRERFRGRATLGFAGGGAILEGPITKNKGSWVVSARRSFLDAFTKDVGFGGVPIVYTLTAKAVYDLTPRDRVWGVTVSGWDKVRLGANDDIPEKDQADEVFNLDIRYQGWRSANGFNWQRLYGGKGVGLLGVTHSAANVNANVRDLVRNGPRPPGVPAADLISRSPTIFRENSRENESTIKYDHTLLFGGSGKIQAGGAFKIFNVSYAVASPFGNDNPYSPVNDVNPFEVNKAFRAYQSGFYAQTTKDLTARLNLTIGARIDDYQYVGRTRLSPRAGLSYRLTNKLSWRGSFGSYYQQPFLIFLATFPQNRNLVPFRADHYVTGFSYLVNPAFRVTVEGYRKDYKDYPVSTQFPALTLAAVGDTFAIADILFPLTSAGRGRVRGIELFAEKKFTNKWFGQANLAFSRNRQGGLDGILRPAAFDYPVVANAVAGYRLNAKWEFSGRWVGLSGRPFTPYNEAISRRQRRGVFDLARLNAERLPAYLRLDVRVDRTFMVRDKPLLVFIGAQNILNRRNVGGEGWNRTRNSSEFGEQLGLFPNIGLDWRF